LYDSKLIYADQERALELDSKVGSRGGEIDYSLLLDGLMAEREQGITIDVAYRYFTTDKRSFIVADTPGHEEYTRNMAVGASFADLAVILVDAKQGVLVQTRRHARICSLMGIKYFVFAVNKMDLVDYSMERYNEIVEQINSLSEELSLTGVQIIPVSATEGDNVTKHSDKMPWYTGDALLTCLEDIDVSGKKKEEGFYMPVQRVCRPDRTFRGFQGQIESGDIKVGDEIVALPSCEHARVKSILIGDKESDSAEKGRPVTIRLDREVDVSRGCVISKETSLCVSRNYTATLLWMDDEELTTGKDYLVKIATKTIPGIIKNIRYRIDVNTGEHITVGHLRKNEIAVCDIVLQEEIVIDAFLKHRVLGEMLLIDRVSNMTSACGVVENPDVDRERDEKSAFASEDIRVGSDIFREFYYDPVSMTVFDLKPSGRTYTVGDKIPVEGDSYCYPDDFDILALDGGACISIRKRRVAGIKPLAEYTCEGIPAVDHRGFALKITDKNSAKQFKKELENSAKEMDESFLNKWADFGTYRRIVFRDRLNYERRTDKQNERNIAGGAALS
jgi:sulfate adenylyltransferase subunit 1